MMEGLASDGGEEKTVMIDATCLRAHRMALSLQASEVAQTSIRRMDVPSNRGPMISAGV
jgi:hypothetical protein